MDNYSVCCKFAQGAKFASGSNLNISLDGKMLLSYGYYAIAKKNGSVAFITSKKYSQTTGRHIAYAVAALQKAGFRCLEIPNIENFRDIANIDYLNNRIAYFEAKAKRARVNKSNWLAIADNVRNDLKLLMSLF